MEWYHYLTFMMIGLGAWGAATKLFKTVPKTAAPAPATGVSADESTDQLYRHAQGIERFVERSAHPRELPEQADFKAATRLLAQQNFET